MRRVSMLGVVLAACEGGQSPPSELVALAEVSCEREDDQFALHVEAFVTLEVGETFSITFLPDIDGGTFQRSTSWECDEYTPALDLRGCDRSAADPDRGTVIVDEINQLVQGIVPGSFEFTTVATITDMLRGIEVEDLLVKDVCP